MLQRENNNKQQLIETMKGQIWLWISTTVALFVEDILSFKIKVIQLKAMLGNEKL